MNNRLIVVHNTKTDTYWTNDDNWKDRYMKEGMLYGTIDLGTDNVFMVKSAMNQDGYFEVKKEDLPF